MVECLTDETVAAYVDGALALDEVGRVDHHIDTCVKCRAQLSTVAASPHSFLLAIQGSAPEVSEVVQDALAHGRAGDPLPQTALGRYVIDAVIGRGGMGVVVRAHDAELDRDVAIKLVAPSQRHGAWRVHVRDEARAMAKLRHPNVVAVYDAGSIGDQLFIAMELVDGTSLARLRGRERDVVLRACLDAGRGLVAAHAAGIVHRDVKPDNILVGTDGRAMIGDFGLARIGDHVRGGTPGYMAPELVRGEPATPASDQYALAVTVCEVITGDRPVGRTRPAKIPKWLWRALARGLAEDPAARYPTLQAFLAGLAKPARRRWVAVAAAAPVIAVASFALARPSAPASAARSRCLHDRWTEHLELIHRIARGTEPNGLVALQALQSSAACEVASGRPFLPRIEQQPAWLAAKQQLVTGMTSAALGHYTEDRAELVPVFEVARRISDDAMIAQAGMVLGDVEVALGHLDAAEKTFEAALQGAAAANEDLGSAKILLRLAHLVGESRQQWDRGAELLRAASAAI
ncbi:MAG: protein kinase, partial [Kofleriaceae bacterium]